MIPEKKTEIRPSRNIAGRLFYHRTCELRLDFERAYCQIGISPYLAIDLV